MQTEMADRTVPELVEAARAGDQHAWAGLIGRFQDLAVAIAVGRLGDVEAACDVAQDAFGLAFSHLADLAEPAAFPGWFGRLVRTACERQRRRAARVVPFADAAMPAADPAAIVVARDEAERVRAAIEALPEPERLVVALHYLAGLSYPEVAAFLGIGLSAARKQAHVARARMKELLPMAADLLAASRPSRDGRFRDTILLFDAIRRLDHEAVRGLLTRDPGLVHVHEDWTAAEAFAAGLPYAAHASPLVRAAGAGDLVLVQLLLEAGADPNEPCGCAGGESPLWAATVTGSADVVAYLLGAGAEPDATTFGGTAPLHVARQRGRDDLAALLLAAGADAEQRDAGGRTPDEWSGLDRRRPAWPGDLVPTGIRALDLFAPLHTGDLQRWPAAYGLGQFVVLGEIALAVAPVRTRWIGFEHDLIGRAEVKHLLAEAGLAGTIGLVPRRTDPGRARAVFAREVDAAVRPVRQPALVVCLDGPGHTHDVALALPRLACSPAVLATLVVEPFSGERLPAGESAPEAYASQVGFDTQRAARGLYPAIDPLTTTARQYPDERHARLAVAARELLRWYAADDPDLALATPDTPRAAAAQRLLRHLAQPLVVAEPFTSRPGERTPLLALLDSVEGMLDAQAR